MRHQNFGLNSLHCFERNQLVNSLAVTSQPRKLGIEEHRDGPSLGYVHREVVHGLGQCQGVEHMLRQEVGISKNAAAWNVKVGHDRATPIHHSCYPLCRYKQCVRGNSGDKQIMKHSPRKSRSDSTPAVSNLFPFCKIERPPSFAESADSQMQARSGTGTPTAR